MRREPKEELVKKCQSIPINPRGSLTPQGQDRVKSYYSRVMTMVLTDFGIEESPYCWFWSRGLRANPVMVLSIGSMWQQSSKPLHMLAEVQWKQCDCSSLVRVPTMAS
jgi:hypothetical protein